MDRFEAMSMFLAAVDCGSLSAAARQLRVPVPTLSRKVAELEARLGTQLLTRTTRRLSLTDAGQAYAAASRRILEQMQEAEQEAAGEYVVPRGELVITAPLLFGRQYLLPVLAEFLAQFPEINIRLALGDRNLSLFDDHIDMAVRFGRLPDSDMIATRVGAMRWVVCASPVLLAGHGTPRVPEDLRKMPCVMDEVSTRAGGWRFRDPANGSILELAMTPRLVATAETAAAAAIRGIGATRLLHYQLREAVEQATLIPLLETYEVDPVPVHLVHMPRGQLPLKMRRFLDFAVPRLRQVLASLGGER